LASNNTSKLMEAMGNERVPGHGTILDVRVGLKRMKLAQSAWEYI